MTMAKKSQATKAVLASLLATSAIVPAIAVNAEVGGETTRTTEAVTTSAAVVKTIDFKVEAAQGSESLQRFIPTSGELVERNGQQFIQLELSESVLGMVNSITVGGQPALHEYGGNKVIYIPIATNYAPVEVSLNMTIPFVGKDPVDYKATLTPYKETIKEVTAETKPAEEKPAVEEKIFAEGNTYEFVANGKYAVKWDAYKEKVGNYKAITNHFAPDAKLLVRNGKYFVQLTVTEGSKDMVAALKIGGKEATEKDGVYTVEIASISDLQEAAVHVVVASANMDKWYEFNFALETADLELPTAPVRKSVTSYKDGTQELSIMHNKYLDDEVTVTATEGGYDLELTFPEGQHLLDFTVEGATVALKSEKEVGKNTVKIYTVSVDDLEKMYTATADLKVIVGGQVLYETAHDFQMKLSKLVAPFSDITNDNHKEFIETLYEEGIFKEADKFNPKDTLKRYQFALMLNRALDLDVPATTNFTDIAKLDQETQDAVKALNAYGIINGTSATTFGAGDGIKRQHAALMIYRVLEKNGYKATGVTSNFTDLPKDAEAVKAINELNNLGIMTGYNGQVTPNAVLTRSQMAKIVNNTLNVLLELK